MLSSGARKKLSGIFVVLVCLVTIVGLSDVFFLLPPSSPSPSVIPSPQEPVSTSTGQ